MPDVFVSYSRRDSEFVHRIVSDLEQHGKSVWLDTHGISDGEVFPEAIRTAIEESDAFVFVITPDSAASEYCGNEVEHALALNKRVIPVLRTPVPDDGLPEAVRVRNWIPFTPDADPTAATERLLSALDADHEHARAHTHWLVKTLDWESHGRDSSFLLRGSELTSAEHWLAGVKDGADPAPTALQREFLYAGRRASSRRQRMLVVGTSIAGLVAVVLAAFALVSRQQATHSAAVSRSRALAADSQSQLTVDPELSILLAMKAARSSATAEAMYALRDAIDTSPGRKLLPAPGNETPAFGHASVAYSPDGRRLAVETAAGSLLIVDTRTDAVVRRIATGQGGISQHAWNHDGSLIAVRVPDAVLLIDPVTGKTRSRIAAMAHALSVAFGSNGIVYADGYTAKAWLQVIGAPGAPAWIPVRQSQWVGTWNPATRRYTPYALPPVTSAWAVLGGDAGLAVSPDGKRLAVGAQPGLAVYDTATARPVTVIAPPWPRTGGQNTTIPAGNLWEDLDYSPDGSLLAGAATREVAGGRGGFPAEIEVFDAATMRLRTVIPVGKATIARAVAFSPDGSRLAYGTWNGGGTVYSLALKRPVVTLPGTGTVALAFSPDGRTLASLGSPRSRLWRATGNERLLITPHGAPGTRVFAALTATRVTAVVTPATGEAAGKMVVESWSRATGRALGTPLVVRAGGDPFTSAALSNDGSYVAVQGVADVKHVSVWDVARRRIVRTFDVGAGGLTIGNDVAWTHDDRYLALAPVASKDPLQYFDRVAGKLHATAVKVTTCDGWDENTAWSPDGSLLGASVWCGDLRVLDRASGRVVYTSKSAGTRVIAGSFSPDDTRVLVAGATSPGSLSVVDLKSGHHVVDLLGVTAQVDRARFSPDGSLIATASTDGIARIWDAHTGHLLRTLPHIAGNLVVAWGPDSSSVITVDADNDIRVWDACSDCGNRSALLALGAKRVTRGLTADERQIYKG